ncbi:hypothetical protein PCASD_23182 [Puccinia coronata f. sp. avenae]|uniref:Uncharacterized protein n=1 Tax=Puccinia coronata f. sp. avenae TaxID=200324 RepID=A0A2N5S4B5_9BASI|nr:hypothetical protein PCASD_23182 [Puccinia coronata f. sp. avenae]
MKSFPLKNPLAPSSLSTTNERLILPSARFQTKHMDLCLHFIRNLVAQKIILLKFVGTHSNIADFMTKPVGCSKITCALTRLTRSLPSLSASSSHAQSMPACQNDDQDMVDADSVMKSICNEIQSENYDPVGYDQDTAPRP